jgi:hypothetical protein
MANLSKEDIARIMSGQAVGPNEYYDQQSGRTYTFRNGDGRYEGDTYIQGDPMEILATDWAPGRFKDNAQMNGQSMDRYGMGGDYLGSETITGLKDRNQFVDIAKILAAPALMYGAQSMGLVGGANPVMGTEAGLSGGGGTSSLMGGAGADGIASGGAGYGIVGGATEPVASIAAGGAGGGGLSGLLTGGAGSLVKGGLSLLAGGLAGDTPDVNRSETKAMDPRMDALFYGDLAPRVQGLLQQQMSPDMMAQNASVRSKGQGLLNQPVAGGFNQFRR